jgi:tetratricopeptide (TPR) repeat protein
VRTDKGEHRTEALLALAGLYRAKRDWAAFDGCIERARKRAPDSDQVLLAYVIGLGERSKYDQMVSLLADPDPSGRPDPSVLMTAASILTASKQRAHLDKAVALLERVTARVPHLTDAQNALAVLAYKTGDTKRAKRICRKVIEVHPDHAQTLNDLAWILAEADKNYDAALELADRGVSLAPQNANLRDTRGTILSKLPSRLKAARADFEKAVELARDDVQARTKALVKLGRTCLKLGEVPHASQYLNEALRMDREHDVLTASERSDVAECIKGLDSKHSAAQKPGSSDG